MYKIELTDYGMKHTFQGILEPKELKAWLAESEMLVRDIADPFNIVLDMRETLPMPYASEEIFYEGKKIISKHGMRRGAVIMDNPEVTRQMRQIAKYANVQHKERYIDSFTKRNWEELSEMWVKDGVDPDRI